MKNNKKPKSKSKSTSRASTSRSALLFIVGIFLFGVSVVTLFSSPPTQAVQSAVNLQTASPFAILAGTPAITDAGNSSVINGNVGLSPATGAGVALLCSQVTGTIYSVDATGPLPCRITDGPLLVTAKNDLTAAFIDAAGRTPLLTVPTELGGTTKTPGVYDSASTTLEITAGAGPLVLDGQGDPSSVFIFEADFGGTGLTVGPGSTISLVNGAQACNIFWRVDTATIDTTAVFKGTIMALNSITVANGANIEGRLLARNGDVTLINDTIRVPTTCAAGTGTGGTGTGTPVTGGTAPKFPNTANPERTYSPLGITISVAGIIAGISIIYIAYKKRKA